MQAELSGMLVITLMLGGWIGIVEWLARHTSIPPEWSRKLVHLGGGAGCLLFPWLLSHPLAVLVLAVGFGVSLWLAEKGGLLQSLCRVERQSYGSLYYPFAIAALFWLTHDDYGLYMSAVLVLTVADTAAALVGARFGRVRFRTGGVGESKSLEGSIAFWVVTFLAVLLPLVLVKSDVSVMQSLLSAFLAATLLTMVEAVSIGGRDNLFVPLIAAFLLLKTVTKSTPELMMQSVSILILFALLPGDESLWPAAANEEPDDHEYHSLRCMEPWLSRLGGSVTGCDPGLSAGFCPNRWQTATNACVSSDGPSGDPCGDADAAGESDRDVPFPIRSVPRGGVGTSGFRRGGTTRKGSNRLALELAADCWRGYRDCGRSGGAGADAART